MNEVNTKKAFFLKGFSNHTVSRVEDLINLHPKINCRGNMDLSGLGRYLEKFFTDKNSIILLERNPQLLKSRIHNLVLHQIGIVCGKNFDVIGASSTDEVRNLFMIGKKYVVVYEELNSAILSQLHYALLTFQYNPNVVSKEYANNSMFKELVERYSSLNYIPLAELEHDLYERKQLVSLLLRDWLIQMTKNVMYYKNAVIVRENILWVSLKALLSDYKKELFRIYNFLGIDRPEVINEDCLSNGMNDYDFNFNTKYDASAFPHKQAEIVELDTVAKTLCKLDY